MNFCINPSKSSSISRSPNGLRMSAPVQGKFIIIGSRYPEDTILICERYQTASGPSIWPLLSPVGNLMASISLASNTRWLVDCQLMSAFTSMTHSHPTRKSFTESLISSMCDFWWHCWAKRNYLLCCRVWGNCLVSFFNIAAFCRNLVFVAEVSISQSLVESFNGLSPLASLQQLAPLTGLIQPRLQSWRIWWPIFHRMLTNKHVFYPDVIHMEERKGKY